jgi:3-oxoacyl-[acyl-carrier-protein] synthase-3
MRRAFLRAVASYLPEKRVSNADLAAAFPGWNMRRFESISGIRNRYEEPLGAASDMALRAVQRIFDLGIKKEDVDFLIVVTQSGDYRLPSTACVLHGKLGLPDSAGALDINLGCSGFVYSLILAKSLVCSGTVRNALIATVEKSSFLVHESDVTLRSILSDAAAAALVSSEQGFAEIGEGDFGTDGAGWSHIIVPAGGSAQAASDETKIPSADADGNLKYPEYERMNGMEIFNFSVERAPESIERALRKNGLSADQIDYFLLHQANRIILESIAAKLKIPPERVPSNIAEAANTSSCSIPILLSELVEAGSIKSGMKLALCGYGVGLSWASVVLAACG